MQSFNPGLLKQGGVLQETCPYGLEFDASAVNHTFLKHSDKSFWHQLPWHAHCYLDDPISSNFWCSVWTSASHFHLFYLMAKCSELLPCDWIEFVTAIGLAVLSQRIKPKRRAAQKQCKSTTENKSVDEWMNSQHIEVDGCFMTLSVARRTHRTWNFKVQ